MYGSNYVPEKYQDYKNRVYSRHLEKAKNMAMQIKQCSLKGDDKQKLIQQIIEVLTSK